MPFLDPQMHKGRRLDYQLEDAWGRLNRPLLSRWKDPIAIGNAHGHALSDKLLGANSCGYDTYKLCAWCPPAHEFTAWADLLYDNSITTTLYLYSAELAGRRTTFTVIYTATERGGTTLKATLNQQ